MAYKVYTIEHMDNGKYDILDKVFFDENCNIIKSEIGNNTTNVIKLKNQSSINFPIIANTNKKIRFAMYLLDMDGKDTLLSIEDSESNEILGIGYWGGEKITYSPGFKFYDYNNSQLQIEFERNKWIIAETPEILFLNEESNINFATMVGNSVNDFFVLIDDIQVDGQIHVTDISLEQTYVTININSSTTLIAKLTPSDATNQNIIWTTSNPNVVTVSDGLLTCVGYGNCTISATSEDGGFVDSCEVAVVNSIIPAGSEIYFEVNCNELTWGDKPYRINIYAKNIKGEWSIYE